jgi:hypothetical protein
MRCSFISDEEKLKRLSHHFFAFLPECLGHRKTKAFAKTFLDNDGGGTLECIDFEWRPDRKFEHVDIGVARSFVENFLVHDGAFGIIGGAAPG